jgi:hypothetical protein
MVGLTRVRAAGLAVLALGGAAVLVGAAVDSGAPARQSPSTLRVFATVTAGSSVELRSVATGAVVSAPRRVGRSWTNNGFALSPDGRYVYFTLIPKSSKWSSLLLERLSVTTHRRRFVAFGEQPAVSPDAGRLAYVSGEDRSASVVVRDLASGRRRSVNVARLLGGKTDMVNASLAWLGDGNQLALLEACCPVAVSSGSKAVGDGAQLIVVSVPPNGGLSARRVAMPAAAEMPGTIGTDTTRPNSLLVSWLIAGDRAAVDRLTIGSSRATLGRVLAVAHSLVVAFDPGGRQLLYLSGHARPDLWAATFNNHRLEQRHLLIRNPSLDAYAW